MMGVYVPIAGEWLVLGVLRDLNLLQELYLPSDYRCYSCPSSLRCVSLEVSSAELGTLKSIMLCTFSI